MVERRLFGGFWQNTHSVTPLEYTCGYCGRSVASAIGFYTNSHPKGNIYICPNCNGPTVTDELDFQFPDVAPGGEVQHVPPDVAALYREARNCVAASAYTGAVLCCRKLLMNIAISEGASKGKHFIEYVEYLSDHGYVPPKGRQWVDHIRNKGNEATHEIVEVRKPDAEDLVIFSEMLLKFIYEFPNKVPQTEQE